jgi:hypothetical protein
MKHFRGSISRAFLLFLAVENLLRDKHMDIIAKNLKAVNEKIPPGVKILAISKNHPVEKVESAYQAGQVRFGENKVQELVSKHEAISHDIEWHMVGHLQTNKVKYIAPFVHMVHSIDKFKLLRKINQEAAKHGRVIPCLLQMHIAREESKFGLDEEGLKEILQSEEFWQMENIQIAGFMGMATFTDDEKTVRGEFSYLRKLFDQVKSEFFSEKDYFRELSMGMSSDFPIAIEEGSTMVRIGSAIFGERNYNQ